MGIICNFDCDGACYITVRLITIHVYVIYGMFFIDLCLCVIYGLFLIELFTGLGNNYDLKNDAFVYNSVNASTK